MASVLDKIFLLCLTLIMWPAAIGFFTAASVGFTSENDYGFAFGLVLSILGVVTFSIPYAIKSELCSYKGSSSVS